MITIIALPSNIITIRLYLYFNNIPYFFSQLIFRKVSDLQKEKELAERRKNDPVLNTSQDHLVRKLFSKFKKTSGNDLASPHSIGSGSIVAAEHGAGINAIQVTQGNNNNNVTSPNASNSITPVITDAAKQRKMSTAMGIAKARPAGGGGGWAKLLVSEKFRHHQVYCFY